MAKARSTRKTRDVAPEPPPPHDEFSDEDEDVRAQETAEARRLQGMLGDLAFADGTSIDDVDWYIYRIRTKDEIARNPEGTIRELVGKKHGAIDLMELSKECGGGTFDLFPVFDSGDGRGKALQPRQRHTLAGPRRDYAGVAAAAVTTVVAPQANGSSAPSSTTDELLKALLAEMRASREGQQERLIHALEMRATAPPAPAVDPMAMMVAMVTAMKGLRDMTPAAPEAVDGLGVARMVMEGVNQGILLGQERGPQPPGEDGPNMMAVIEKGIEAFTKLQESRRPFRPPQGTQFPGAPAAPVSPQSEARVVEQPTRENAIPHQWQTAVASMYRAMATGEDPRDFAETLRGILMPEDLEAFVQHPEQVVGGLLPLIQAQYPALASQQGEIYVGSVIAELRSPTQDPEEVTN